MSGSRLETTVNVCLITTCILVSVAAGKRLWSGDPATSTAGSTGYKLGDTLPTLEGVRFTDKPKTLLLVVSSRCKFCTDSMPFYAKLSAARRASAFQFVVAGSEPEAALTTYLTRNGVEADRIVVLRPGTLRVTATPTIILADSVGSVSGYWRGALSGRELEVEAALAR
jgi:hypothetical protein